MEYRKTTPTFGVIELTEEEEIRNRCARELKKLGHRAQVRVVCWLADRVNRHAGEQVSLPFAAAANNEAAPERVRGLKKTDGHRAV